MSTAPAGDHPKGNAARSPWLDVSVIRISVEEESASDGMMSSNAPESLRAVPPEESIAVAAASGVKRVSSTSVPESESTVATRSALVKPSLSKRTATVAASV
jgi:hypothetical protein